LLKPDAEPDRCSEAALLLNELAAVGLKLDEGNISRGDSAADEVCGRSSARHDGSLSLRGGTTSVDLSDDLQLGSREALD